MGSCHKGQLPVLYFMKSKQGYSLQLSNYHRYPYFELFTCFYNDLETMGTGTAQAKYNCINNHILKSKK